MTNGNFSTSLVDLDPQDVQDFEEFLKAFIESEAPTIDVSRGTVFFDLVIRPAAIMQALAVQNINRYRRSSSLLEVMQAPNIFEPEILDAILSNFRLTRRQGEQATGFVTIYISSNATTAIPSGSTFVSGLLQFRTSEAFIGVPSQNFVTKSTDKLIRYISSGVYAFDVGVTAVEEGEQYQLTKGTALTLQNPPSNYIYAKALYDFSTGLADETNEEVLLRLPDGIAGKTVSSRRNIRALVKDFDSHVLHGSIIGYGDPEMQRDKGNIFKIGYGGKADIYVQTELRPIEETTQREAMLVSAAEGKWQIFFDRDDFAGVYKIISILPQVSTDLGSLPITTDVRTVNNSPLGTDTDSFAPDIQNYTQAAFSRFQEATVEFVDATFDASELPEITTTRLYDVTVLRMPRIMNLQDDLISDYWICGHRYDDIVRAPIPCLVSATFGIRLRRGSSFNISALQNSIADRINRLGFSLSMSSSLIADAAHDLLDATAQVIMPIDLLGELIDPENGVSRYFRSSSTLRVPLDYLKSISERAVMFFADPADVSISMEYA